MRLSNKADWIQPYCFASYLLLHILIQTAGVLDTDDSVALQKEFQLIFKDHTPTLATLGVIFI